jgi:hypothetical protein
MGNAMKMQIQQLAAAVVGLAIWLPLPAAAEMRGTGTCASPSWTALASGECGIGALHIVRQSGNTEEDNSIALVDLPVADVPEPETYALMLVGLVAVATAVWRRRGNRGA